MIPFTDADRDRLKWAVLNPAPNWADKDNLAGLLDRLEAAEKVCRYCTGEMKLPEGIDATDEAQFCDQALEEWRKAAGR